MHFLFCRSSSFHCLVVFSSGTIAVSSKSKAVPPEHPGYSAFALPFATEQASSVVYPTFDSMADVPFALSTWTTVTFIKGNRGIVKQEVPALVPFSHTDSVTF